MIKRPSWLLALSMCCAGVWSCSDDGEGVQGCGADSLCLDAAVQTDATALAPLDGSNEECPGFSTLRIDDTYKFWGHVGGLNAQDFYSELTNDTYRRVQELGKVVATCSEPLPTCPQRAVDRPELVEALAHPDVVAAFAEAGPNLELAFGRVYSFSADVDHFVIQKGLSKRFGVGGACSGAPGCREVPAGVAQLVQLLNLLDQLQERGGGCAGFPAPQDAGVSAGGGAPTGGLDAGP